MAILSLFEAAEQAATSKVDVWRAIQDGALPARRTNDGGYAIDQADLFRVFERKQPETGMTPDWSSASEDASVAKSDEVSEPAAATDVSDAFAALQAELKRLLGSHGEASPAGEETCQSAPKSRP